ncbi:hypothetical protein ACFQBY_01650 [Promicromonospora citrea]|uniref:DUF7878 domain-containing protein n=1 Tax=Promicromonospora citrea TaxID=43677 RepID=UPI001488CD70|nr:hypothetical protein [Promicromonospora citrea]NNH52919.1 hypothetical protein [Promicromonospora citrea]
MMLTYANFDDADLQGSTLADHLIAVEAEFRIVDGLRTVYEEPHFPIAELARSLSLWLRDGARGFFIFDSMAFEELGVVMISRADLGWKFSSVFTPALASSCLSWSEVEGCVRGFIDQVERDLIERGHDAAMVLRG